MKRRGAGLNQRKGGVGRGGAAQRSNQEEEAGGRKTGGWRGWEDGVLGFREGDDSFGAKVQGSGEGIELEVVQ